jgi:hypothetical protein
VLTSLASIGRLRSVGSIQFLQVPFDALVDLLHPLGQLVRRKVLVPVIDRLELAAINGDDGLGKQVKPPTQEDELPADVADRLTVVVTEVSDGLKVG